MAHIIVQGVSGGWLQEQTAPVHNHYAHRLCCHKFMAECIIMAEFMVEFMAECIAQCMARMPSAVRAPPAAAWCIGHLTRASRLAECQGRVLIVFGSPFVLPESGNPIDSAAGLSPATCHSSTAVHDKRCHPLGAKRRTYQLCDKLL
jgi:hypothetical protein